uniref:Uncharacterized protein n=1 Tax=Anguilla anguilla TaxID=7936 RepID=A0A0E9TP89_ANGAN
MSHNGPPASQPHSCCYGNST